MSDTNEERAVQGDTSLRNFVIGVIAVSAVVIAIMGWVEQAFG